MSDFDFVTRRLATGGFIKTTDQAKAVVDADITHVVDCWGEEDHSAVFADTSVAIVRPQPLLDDGSPKPPDWFAHGILFSLTALSSPKARVLAHCCAGADRALAVLGYA